jgi:alkylation response protein AidB-like acyl-CoA dehydrogenase
MEEPARRIGSIRACRCSFDPRRRHANQRAAVGTGAACAAAVHNGAMFTPGCTRPDPSALRSLTADLARFADATDAVGPWRSGSFAACAHAGLLAGFVPADCGGTGAAEPALLEALAAVAERCLTTALALSQWAAACRIIASGGAKLRAARLPALARGETSTTVGISQLSTSRRHLATPALTAVRGADGWRLDGLCPWVTGADACNTIVTGAVTAGGERLFFVVPSAAAGLEIGPPLPLVALSGSRTSSVVFRGVAPADVIPPAVDGGVRTGGLATTALALGSIRGSVAIVERESGPRVALEPVAAGLRDEADEIAAHLHRFAAQGGEPADRDRLRARATSLALRAAQAALAASKGAGFVAGHAAGRLARESLFFLVWSCPESVSAAVMCELAGLAGG